MSITYREIKALLDEMTDGQLDCDVVVWDMMSDEYRPITRMEISTDECDVLDLGHPMLIIDEEKY